MCGSNFNETDVIQQNLLDFDEKLGGSLENKEKTPSRNENLKLIRL